MNLSYMRNTIDFSNKGSRQINFDNECNQPTK